MEDWEKLKLEKEKARKMESSEVKRILAEEYGYDSRYLYYLDEDREFDELAYCILERDPSVRSQFPHGYAGLPDGSYIERDGSVSVDPWIALVIGHGYTHEEVAALDDVYLEWCKVTHTEPDPEYLRKKEAARIRKEKQDAKKGIKRFAVKKFNG